MEKKSGSATRRWLEGNEKPKNSFLSPYRALDLTDQKGYMCGKILAGLGAEVIKVEPPKGDPGRTADPFPSEAAGSTRSFYWCAYNVNKDSITLDLTTGQGRELFKRLVKKNGFRDRVL